MSEVSFGDVLDAILVLQKQLEETYVKLDRRLAKIEEKTETRILYTKTLSPPIEDEPEAPPIFEKLRDAGFEPIGKLTFDPTMIKPIKFLGDEWSTINRVLQDNGYTWIREGRNSRWTPVEV